MKKIIFSNFFSQCLQFSIVLFFTSPAAARPWAEKMGLRLSPQMQVLQVEDFSFASVIAPECGGIRVGDTIGALNGIRVKSPAQFESVAHRIANRNPGPWSFLVERKKQIFTAEIAREYLRRCQFLSLINCGPAHSQPAVDSTMACLDQKGNPVRRGK